MRHELSVAKVKLKNLNNTLLRVAAKLGSSDEQQGTEEGPNPPEPGLIPSRSSHDVTLR